MLSQNRYKLGPQLGQGGMGVVHLADDRLAGCKVAIKRLHGQRVAEGSRAERARTALAHEFKLLASLHHPHIVSVLDYGFDAELRPFLVMEFLPESEPLTLAAASRPLPERIALLLDALAALGYLHRRGILHRDLKPSNVVLAGEGAARTVKLLDFGLALAQGEQAGLQGRLAGTLPYLAPELLRGTEASERSDLFSFGILACEVLTGWRPFGGEDSQEQIHELLWREPDLEIAGLAAELRAVLRRLLDKHPEARFASATAAARALAAAAAVPLPSEEARVREGFLRAARLVGREAELEQLCGALRDLQHGHGGVFTVEGESGIGKSRLLEELRTLALVGGALVLRGQAVRNSGNAFAELREILRRLILICPPDPEQAAALGAVFPEFGPGADRGDGRWGLADAAAQRSERALTAYLLTIPVQTVLLLEDMQWASAESLRLLCRLAEQAPERPLLVIASFRTPEGARVPAALAARGRIRLERLQRAQIAELCESMVGAPGRRPDLVTLLARETHGNPLLLTESVRAFAEVAGGLSELERAPLPAAVLAGGVERLLSHRLAQVPPTHQELLRLCAVLGPQLDLAVLCVEQPDPSRFLSACGNAGVLEVYEARWRFTHAQLAETLLQQMDAVQLRALHRRAAAALECVYGADPVQAAALFFHFSAARDERRAVQHGLRASAHAAFGGSLDEAERLSLLTLGLLSEPTTEPQDRIHARYMLAVAQIGSGRSQDGYFAVRDALAAAGLVVPQSQRAWARAVLGHLLRQLARALPLPRLRRPASSSAARAQEAALLLALVECSIWRLDRRGVIYSVLAAATAAAQSGSADLASRSECCLALLTAGAGMPRLARSCLSRAERLRPRSGAPVAFFLLCRVRALLATAEGRWPEARRDCVALIEHAEQQGHTTWEMQGHDLYGAGLVLAGDLEPALKDRRTCAELAQRLGGRHIRARALTLISMLLLRQGRLVEAERTLTAARTEGGERADRLVTLLLTTIEALYAVQTHESAFAERAITDCLTAMDGGHTTALPLFHAYRSLALACAGLRTPAPLSPQLAQEGLRIAVERLGSMERGFRIARPAAALFRGHLYRLSGRTAAARREVQRSLTMARALGMAFDEAQAHEALAQLAAKAGAEVHAESARSVYKRIGATWHAQQLEQGSR